jgi:hypothetical protein
MNKQQLLMTLRDERAAWDTLLNSLSDKQSTTPGITGEWSVKDIIAHINAWESRPVAWLEAIERGAQPTPPSWSRDLDEDSINAWIFKTNRHRSLPEVRNEARQTFERLVQGIERMDEEQLNTPIAWLNHSAFSDSIAGNTWEHYQAHAEMIRAWLAQNK